MRIFLILAVVLSSLLTSGPVFAQENVKPALQNIVDNLDKLSKLGTTNKNKKNDSEEIKIRKSTFKNILELARIESNNLKNKLIKLDELEDDYSNLRDRYLKELNNHNSYYESIDVALEKESSLVKIKELAIQFKDWRKIVYHPTLQKVINFLLIFKGKDILQIAENRFNNVSADLKKVEDYEIIKNSPLADILVKAEKSLDEAKELQSAAELIILKANNNDIQKLIEDELAKIKGTYKYFIEMSNWVKEASGK